MELIEQKNKSFENDYLNQKNMKKRKLRTNGETTFTYKFLEGVNNSIKYDVQIELFFPKAA